MFYNYKGYFSINLMSLIDADYHFIFLGVGNYGSNGDRGVFKATAFGQAFMDGNLHVRTPKELLGYPQGGALLHYIVAYEAFPLWMDLLRPFPRVQGEARLPYAKTIFNYRLSRAMRIVENAFGILVQHFRVYDRRLCMDDHHVIKIVNDTCVLHNYLCTANMDVANVMGRLNPWGATYMQPQVMLQDLQNVGYHSKRHVQRVRNIYKDYSQYGAVAWQGNRICHH